MTAPSADPANRPSRPSGYLACSVGHRANPAYVRHPNVAAALDAVLAAFGTTVTYRGLIDIDGHQGRQALLYRLDDDGRDALVVGAASSCSRRQHATKARAQAVVAALDPARSDRRATS
jgi:hypothetical protein